MRYRWPMSGLLIAATISVAGLSPRGVAASVPQASAPSSGTMLTTSEDEPPLPDAAMQNLPARERGDLDMAYGRYMAAIEAYEQAPRSAEVWNMIGMAYHHLGGLGEARHDYERALMIRPNYPEAINNLGATYFEDHQYKKAIRLYRHAQRLMPHSAVIAANLGTAYFARGKFGKGMEEYEKAFRLDPAVFGNPDMLSAPGTTIRAFRAEEDYCLAELFAEAGMQKQAMNYLLQAFNEGFNDRERLMHDSVFAQLRKSTQFAELMALQK